MDVKHLCLGVLCTGEASGYDIKKYFESSFRHIFVAGYGSIYPALSDLLSKGLVEVEKLQQERLPDKKMYRVTAAGREAFQTALEKTVPRHKVRSQFLALMHFAHLLPTERVVAAMDTHLAELRALVQMLEQSESVSDSGFGEVFARNYALESNRSLIAFVAEQRDQLLAV